MAEQLLEDPVKRDTLKTVGAALTGATLAGCATESSDNGYEETEDNGYEDNETENEDNGGEEEEPEISYELEIQKLEDADYTNLEFLDEGFTLEQLRQEQDHAQVKYAVNEIKEYETQKNETNPVDPNHITNIEVELEKYDNTFSLEELEQELENSYADDQLIQLGYQELLDGENHIEITATLENQETTTADTNIHKTDPQQEWQQKRREYRDEILDSFRVNWKNWVDQNIEDMKVEEDTDSQYPYMQRQIGMIANEWVGEVRSHNTYPSLHAENLGLTLEYAFQEHLNTELQAGQINNNHLRGGTHHTVIARNKETENIWHVDTGGGTTGEPERISGDGGIYRMSLDWGHHHTEERHYAEVLATAFTRTETSTPGYRERLSHTDEALEHIVTLKRTDGNYNTIEEQTRNTALLAHHYPNQHFTIDKNTDGETELEITAQ